MKIPSETKWHFFTILGLAGLVGLMGWCFFGCSTFGLIRPASGDLEPIVTTETGDDGNRHLRLSNRLEETVMVSLRCDTQNVDGVILAPLATADFLWKRDDVCHVDHFWKLVK